ncbi:MAG: hypothetical protein K1X83_11535 [Oligoflexia bacterium]|nr:hypothetical protein [Oligoflexia bacterium]
MTKFEDPTTPRGCDRCSAQPGEPLCATAFQATTLDQIHSVYNPARQRTCVVIPGINRALHISRLEPKAALDSVELTLRLELREVAGKRVPLLSIDEIREFAGMRMAIDSWFEPALELPAESEGGEALRLEIPATGVRRVAEGKAKFGIEVQLDRSDRIPDRPVANALVTLTGSVADFLREKISKDWYLPGGDPLSRRITVQLATLK